MRTTGMLLAIALLIQPCGAQEKMIDVIPNLYGGDGILLATAPAASHTAHFSIESAASINRLNEQISAEVGGFPFSSTVGGFSFAFDPSIGDFVSTTKTLGPLIAELPTTSGKGRLNLNLSYTYLSYEEFSGRSLDNFKVTALHQTNVVGFPDVHEQFENDVVEIEMDLDIRTQIVAFSATYGLFERLDLGVLLPYSHVSLDVRTLASVVQAPEKTLFPGIHSFSGGAESSTDQASRSASGVGDIIIRGKYNLLKGDGLNLATAALFQLGTADREEFLGSGNSVIRPFLIASKTLFGTLTPHVNVGYEFNLDRDSRSAFEYTVGFDAGSSKLTFAGEILGSHESDGDGIGDDIVDTAWGLKWNPRGKLLVGLNSRISLNDSGLRSTIATTLTVEYGF
jgi:hypothetical protein